MKSDDDDVVGLGCIPPPSRDILVLATPVCLGHMSSVAQRVLERLDAELSNTDDAGRPALAGKVAVFAVVGNEDGAHKVTAAVFQALNDVRYSLSAQGSTYWNGEATQTTDYIELEKVPDAVAFGHRGNSA